MSRDLKDKPSSPGNSRSGKEQQRGEIKTTLQMVCNRQGGLFRPGRDASVLFTVSSLSFKIQDRKHASTFLFVSNDQQVPQTPKPEGELTVSTDEAH